MNSSNYEMLVIARLDKSKSNAEIKKDVRELAGKKYNNVIRIQAQLDKTKIGALKASLKDLTASLGLNDKNLKQFDVMSLSVNKFGQTVAKISAKYVDDQGMMAKATQEVNLTNSEFTKRAKISYKEIKFEAQTFLDTVEDIGINMTSIKNNILPKFVLNKTELATANKAMERLAAVKMKLDAGGKNMTEKELKALTYEAKRAQKQLKGVSDEARIGGKWAMNFGEKLKQAMTGFSLWQIVTNAFFLVKQGIKEAFKATVEFETAMVNFNKVASLTSEELEQVGRSAFQLSKDFGQSGKAAINIMTEYKRAGFSVAESTDLAATSMMLMNVGEVTLSETTDALISVLANYNMEASRSIDVADKLNEVSNKTSATVQGLANGLQRSAGVLSQTGTSLDENLGLLVAGFTTLRNMEKVSTGLITVTTRMKKVKDGEEEMAELTPKLEAQFKRLGLTLLDSTGEFKSTYDILKDLSEIYPELNSLQQANINFLVAGTRQAPVLTAILNDFALAEEAVGVSGNSMGSALKENAIQMESTAKKIEVMKAKWESFWITIIDTKGIKSAVDMAGNLAETLENLSNKSILGFSSLNLILMVTVSLLVAIKREALIAGASRFFAPLAKGALAFLATTKQVIAGQVGLKLAIQTSTLAMNVFYASATLGISVLLGLLVKSIQKNKEYEDSTVAMKEQIGELAVSTRDVSKAKEKFDKDIADTKSMEVLMEATDTLRAKLVKLKEELSYDRAIKNIEDLTEEIVRAEKELTIVGKVPSKTKEQIEEMKRRLENLKLGIKGITDAEAELAKSSSIVNAQKKWEAYTEAMSKAHNIEIGYKGTLEDQVDVFTSLEKKMLDQAETLEDIKDLKQSILNGDKISISQIIELIGKYPELGAQIVNINSSKEAGLAVTRAIFDAEKANYRLKSEEDKKELERLRVKTVARLKELALVGVSKMSKLEELAVDDGSKTYQYGGRDRYVGDKKTNALMDDLNIILNDINNINLIGGILEDTTWESLDTSVKEVVDTAGKLEKIPTAFENMADSIDSLKDRLKKASDQVDEYGDNIEKAINKQKDGIKEVTRLESIRLQEAIDGEKTILDNMKLKDELAKESSDIAEKEQEIIEKQAELASVIVEETDKRNKLQSDYQLKVDAWQKAQERLTNVKKERNTRILENGEWTWQANPKELLDAQDAIDKAKMDADEAQKAIQTAIETANVNIKKANDSIREAQADLEKTLAEQAYKESIRVQEAIIQTKENEKKAYETGQADIVRVIETSLTSLKEIEATNFTERLAQLKTFVSSFNSTMAGQGQSNISVAEPANLSSTTGEAIAQIKALRQTWRDSPDERADIAKKSLDIGNAAGLFRGNDGNWYKDSNKTVKAFSGGGVNDYTGKADLHGTPTKPELILNNQQVGYLFNLIKGGAQNYMSGTKSAVLSGGADGISIGELNITAKNGDTLISLIGEAKAIAKNGFKR